MSGKKFCLALVVRDVIDKPGAACKVKKVPNEADKAWARAVKNAPRQVFSLRCLPLCLGCLSQFCKALTAQLAPQIPIELLFFTPLCLACLQFVDVVMHWLHSAEPMKQ